MKDQLTLLSETPWDALIILDACRADVFTEICSAQAETIRSPARRTDKWLHNVGKVFRDRNVIYFAANPVIARETVDWQGIDRVDIWETHWGRYSSLNLPCVHPLVVNGVVGTWRDLGLLKDRTIVVHYLQPHSPYIGRPPYALSWLRQGIKGCKMTAELNKVRLQPDADAINWKHLRRAYRGNVRLAWQAAEQMANNLTAIGRKVIITSDHGDLLGESRDGGKGGPRFGHQRNYRNPLLHEVPWLPWESSRTTTMMEKLESLGYA